jgi:hypothetical protein
MRVTDLWRDDNGFMFAWKIAFDPSLVPDCSVRSSSEHLAGCSATSREH